MAAGPPTSRRTTPNQRPDDELHVGRTGPTYAIVYDWVGLSDVSSEAAHLYGLLCMHINRQRGDSLVWPGTDVLARMLKRSRGDKVTRWIRELVDLGAVEVEQYGMPRRNRYTIHLMPPDGYAGPTTLDQWYDLHRDLIDAQRTDAKVKRDARREAAKPLVSPVTPKTGGQAVAPKTGELVAPEPGEHVAPVSGREPLRTEPLRTEPLENPRPGTAGARRTARNARARTSAAPPRDDSQPDPSPEASEAFAGLPRAWRDAPPWVRRLIVRRMDTAAIASDNHGTIPLTPAAVAAAIHAYAPHGPGHGPVVGHSRQHLRALEDVIARLVVDVCTGTRSPVTGEVEDEPGEPVGPGVLVLTPGVCARCDSPDATARPDADGMFACDDCWAIVTAEDVGHAA